MEIEGRVYCTTRKLSHDTIKLYLHTKFTSFSALTAVVIIFIKTFNFVMSQISLIKLVNT